MQFIELSAILKQSRIEKNITTEELAQKLKIPLRGIIALEEGDLAELPHETYIRTFTKEYAKLVGLDVDDIRAMLSTVEEFEAQVEPPKSMEAIHAESEPKGAKSKGVRLAVPLLLLALIGTTCYFYYSSGKLNFSDLFSISWFSSSSDQSANKDDKNLLDEKNTIVSTNETNNNKTIDNTNKDIDENINQEANSQKTQLADATQQDTSLVAPETQTENTTIENTTKQDTIDKVNAQADFDFETFIAKTPEASLIDWSDFNKSGNLSKQAIIYVKQDCWMQVIVDGKDGHFTLRANNQRKFDFNKSIQFKIGNASAVTLFHGYDLVNVGDSSVLRVVTLNAK